MTTTPKPRNVSSSGSGSSLLKLLGGRRIPHPIHTSNPTSAPCSPLTLRVSVNIHRIGLHFVFSCYIPFTPQNHANKIHHPLQMGKRRLEWLTSLVQTPQKFKWFMGNSDHISSLDHLQAGVLVLHRDAVLEFSFVLFP